MVRVHSGSLVSSLHSLDYHDPSPLTAAAAHPVVEHAVVVRERVEVRAEKPQVRMAVVRAIAIDVIPLERNLARSGLSFAPTAQEAVFPSPQSPHALGS